MRLITSELALQIVVALTVSSELTLSELGHTAGAPISSTKRALEILIEDGYARRSRRAYELVPSPATDRLVRLTEELLDPITIIRVAARATAQVEFVGQDADRLLVVFGRAGDPMLESRLAALFERQAERMTRRLDLRTHDDVRSELDVDPERRDDYLTLDTLVGDADAAFPDRRLHGVTDGEPLGRPNPLLRLPSHRALHRFKQLHGLRSVKIFGSAVRTDFRPDSDVDVAIRLAGRPSLEDLIAIEHQLEHLLGRDVDVILESNARPAVRAAIEREGVEILQ